MEETRELEKVEVGVDELPEVISKQFGQIVEIDKKIQLRFKAFAKIPDRAAAP